MFRKHSRPLAERLFRGVGVPVDEISVNDFNTGDHVMFEGAEYVSLIDANTWSPTAYPQGWEKTT